MNVYHMNLRNLHCNAALEKNTHVHTRARAHKIYYIIFYLPLNEIFASVLYTGEKFVLNITYISFPKICPQSTEIFHLTHLT